MTFLDLHTAQECTRGLLVTQRHCHHCLPQGGSVPVQRLGQKEEEVRWWLEVTAQAIVGAQLPRDGTSDDLSVFSVRHRSDDVRSALEWI